MRNQFILSFLFDSYIYAWKRAQTVLLFLFVHFKFRLILFGIYFFVISVALVTGKERKNIFRLERTIVFYSRSHWRMRNLCHSLLFEFWNISRSHQNSQSCLLNSFTSWRFFDFVLKRDHGVFRFLNAIPLNRMRSSFVYWVVG